MGTKLLSKWPSLIFLNVPLLVDALLPLLAVLTTPELPPSPPPKPLSTSSAGQLPQPLEEPLLFPLQELNNLDSPQPIPLTRSLPAQSRPPVPKPSPPPPPSPSPPFTSCDW